MKKIVVLLLFIALYLKPCYSQNISSDSSATNQKMKVKIGFYVMPTYSFNSGKKVVPRFYDGSDCNCGHSFSNTKETGNMGYVIGVEVESKKISKTISISGGISFATYNYSGTATETFYHFFVIADVDEPRLIKYSYTDYFVQLPVLVHYELLTTKASRLHALLGVSGEFFLNESNSGGVNHYGDDEFNGNNTSFLLATTGIDYFYGKKTLLNVGFRFSTQLNKTPLGRRLGYAGVKAGVFF